MEGVIINIQSSVNKALIWTSFN